MRTLGQAVLAAVVGYIVGGFVGAVIFAIWIEDVPDGGTGNARDLSLWGGVGGLIGAAAAALTVVGAVQVRRSRVSS